MEVVANVVVVPAAEKAGQTVVTAVPRASEVDVVVADSVDLDSVDLVAREVPADRKE